MNTSDYDFVTDRLAIGNSGVAKLPCGHSCALTDARRAWLYTCGCGQRYVFVEVCDCASCAVGLTCWRSSRPVIAAGSETENPVSGSDKALGW